MCRRWRAVSARTELLREVAFYGSASEGSATVQRAPSLLLWMQRHGQGVRSLDLGLGIRDTRGTDEEMEVVSLLDGCITVCAGSLERLTLCLFGHSYTLGAWTAIAHRLEELTLDMEICTVWATLEHLTSLQRLHLDAVEWQLGTTMALPASLTRLCISNHDAEEPPSQWQVTGGGTVFEGVCWSGHLRQGCWHQHKLAGTHPSTLWRRRWVLNVALIAD